MVDYLLRRRYIKTAKAVTESAGIEVRHFELSSFVHAADSLAIGRHEAICRAGTD